MSRGYFSATVRYASGRAIPDAPVELRDEDTLADLEAAYFAEEVGTELAELVTDAFGQVRGWLELVAGQGAEWRAIAAGTSSDWEPAIVAGAGGSGEPGPQGPQGPTGPQGIQGSQGAAGTGITMKGSVATTAALPASGNAQGDAYIVQADDSLHVYDGTHFVSGGSIQGPPGAQGPTGATGIQGPAGAAGATGATGPSGQSAGKIFYLATTDASDIATYKTALPSPSAAAEQTVVTSIPTIGVDVLVATFATDPGVPGAVDYPAGTAFRRLYAQVSPGSTVAKFHLQVHKRNAAGVETLIRDEFSPGFSDTAVALQEWTATAAAAGVLLATDRLVLRLYAQRFSGGGSGSQVTTYFEGSTHASQIQTTISAGAQGPEGPAGPPGGTATPEAWTTVPMGDMSQGWARLDDSIPPQYRKRPDGVIEMRGMVTPGIQGRVFGLPAGYRHDSVADLWFPVIGQGGAVPTFAVQSNGEVWAQYNFAGLAWVNLAGIRFSVAGP